MRKIIIDTDPGHDDALAIMLAVKSDQFDIKAITTVAGNSSIENTTRNARYLLNLLQREDIPVYSGADKPLQRELIRAVVHGKSGLDGINPDNEPKLTGNAIEKIIEIIEENPGEITLVCLGPLTNIALAMQKFPEIMKKIKEIIMMGGAVKVPGNKNRVAEFNIFVDPEAADIVFRFPVKKTIIPLDACNKVRMYMEDFEKIVNLKLRAPILAMMKPFIANINENEGVNAALVYDALTVYYLLNPEACRAMAYDILIETKGELTRGMTVADLRSKPESQNLTDVVEYINENRFKRDFIKTLSKESNIKVVEKTGKDPGKTAIILAGVHGNEICGVKAFDKLIPQLEIESGKVIFIYANLEAIKQDKRQIDFNLNRCLLNVQPENIVNTLEGKTAREIIPYLNAADSMLDIHASFTKDSIPFVICGEKQIEYAKIFDAEIASFNWDEFEPGSTDYFMNIQGKPGFGFECGYREDPKTQETAEKAVIKFLVYNGNIKGQLDKKEKQRVLRIKSIYKNKNSQFKIARYFADFEKLEERTLIGKDGDKGVYGDKDDILIFVTEREEINKECFLTAEEIDKNLLNCKNLIKMEKGGK